jgi:predicted methyltransferase
MIRVLRTAALIIPLLFLLPRFSAQSPAPPSRPTSTPYTGDLSIFETPGRDERLQIQRVMDLLDIHPGSTVADIGAGSGWFTVPAAARVGKSGMVYAEDINPDAIDYIRKRADKAKLANVHVVLGTADNPNLPAQSVNAVLMLKVYHEVANTTALLANLKSALKPDATIGIIDRNGDGSDHGLMPDVVKREMLEAGFRLSASYDFTKADGQDYFLIFKNN